MLVDKLNRSKKSFGFLRGHQSTEFFKAMRATACLGTGGKHSLRGKNIGFDDAIKAAKRDRERCRHPGTGMYSDVLVYQIDLDGELHPVDEREYEKQKE
jgi:hypothetical protein